MNYEDYITIDPRFYRPEELRYLKGDSSKAKEVLGWQPETSFEAIMDEMILHWQKKLAK